MKKNLIVLLVTGVLALSFSAQSHGIHHATDSLDAKTLWGKAGYAAVTMHNVLELVSHCKVIKDFVHHPPRNLWDGCMLLWNMGEATAHSFNTFNYGTELLHDHDHHDHEHEHEHEAEAQGHYGYYAKLAVLNGFVFLGQALTLQKYWNEPSSLLNRAVLISTTVDFGAHMWDLYYSIKKSVNDH